MASNALRGTTHYSPTITHRMCCSISVPGIVCFCTSCRMITSGLQVVRPPLDVLRMSDRGDRDHAHRLAAQTQQVCGVQVVTSLCLYQLAPTRPSCLSSSLRIGTHVNVAVWCYCSQAHSVPHGHHHNATVGSQCERCKRLRVWHAAAGSTRPAHAQLDVCHVSVHLQLITRRPSSADAAQPALLRLIAQQLMYRIGPSWSPGRSLLSRSTGTSSECSRGYQQETRVATCMAGTCPVPTQRPNGS